MKIYRLYEVDAFTTRKFQGNPAGVVANARGLEVEQMQSIARELNHSETAFLLPPSGPDHHVWIRYFTPVTEVPSCGHATIAAHYVRAVEQGLPSGTYYQRIGIGVLPVDIIRVEDDIEVVMTQGGPSFEQPLAAGLRSRVLAALGLTAGDLDPRCPVQIASTGHSKVMIGMRQQERLHRLQPDLGALSELSAIHGSNGYFIFTLDAPEPELMAHARMFAPAIGIAEDPVTGNGSGPLGAYLVRHGLLDGSAGPVSFRCRQGQAMGRPGTVNVTVESEAGHPSRVKVGGRAVIVFQGERQI